MLTQHFLPRRACCVVLGLFKTNGSTMLKLFERLVAAGDTDWKSLKNKKKKTIFYCCWKAITNTPYMAEVTDWNHIIRKTSSLSQLSNFCQKTKHDSTITNVVDETWMDKTLEILNCVAKNVLLRLNLELTVEPN